MTAASRRQKTVLPKSMQNDILSGVVVFVTVGVVILGITRVSDVRHQPTPPKMTSEVSIVWPQNAEL